VAVDVATGLERGQRPVNGEEGVDGAHTGIAGASVRGLARYFDPKGQRPGVGPHESGAGGLGDDARVTRVATPQGPERAQPAVLLADHEVHREAAAQHSGGADRRQRGEHRRESRLHVTGAAAVDDVAHHPGDERVARPLAEVARRHHIDVALQNQCRSLAVTRRAAHQAPRLRPRHFGTRVVEVRAQPGQVHGPQVDVEAQTLQAPGQEVLQFGLGGTARHARHGDQLREQSGEFGLVHGGERRRLLVVPIHRHDSPGLPRQW
jgi:hypothetical protein